jgi:hypothetical protein
VFWFWNFAFIVVALPIWQCYFLATRYNKLDEEEYRLHYGTAYEGINLANPYAYLRPIMYYIRRIAIIAIFYLGRDTSAGLLIGFLLIN